MLARLHFKRVAFRATPHVLVVNLLFDVSRIMKYVRKKETKCPLFREI
jgi:hypothetical protein